MDKKENLRQCAMELFSANGFKDTNVAEITRRAGVATGTFYLYYPSKEQLFMELSLEENLKLKKALMAQINADGEPLQVIQTMMQANIAGMQANPILREWFNKEVFNKIEEHFIAEKGLQQVNFLYTDFLEIIQRWQAQGKLRTEIEAEMIMALFSVIVVIDLHKEEIGVQYFPQIQEHLAAFIMAGLTPRPAGRQA